MASPSDMCLRHDRRNASHHCRQRRLHHCGVSRNIACAAGAYITSCRATARLFQRCVPLSRNVIGARPGDDERSDGRAVWSRPCYRSPRLASALLRAQTERRATITACPSNVMCAFGTIGGTHHITAAGSGYITMP